MLSENGSPLSVFGGARATFGINDDADAEPIIQVALQSGEELTDVNSAAALGAEAREEAKSKVQLLQVRCLRKCHLITTDTSECRLQDQLANLLQALS